MKFTKGNKIGKGRPRGSTNLASREIRGIMTNIVSDNIEQAKKRFEALDDTQYFKVLGMFLKHILPQQKQIEMEVQSNEDEYQEEIIKRLDKLSDKQVEDFVVGLADEASRKLHEERKLKRFGDDS